MKKIMLLKKLLTAILLTIFVNYSFAQLENTNWYFGTNGGINFNDGSLPPTLITSSNMIARGGSASVSDAAGNLLFYTNSSNVWNSNNQVMPNGEDLLGSPESSQSVVIVPNPANSDEYFIITNAGNSMGQSGLYYTVVNITADSGLGDVDKTQKNIQLLEESMSEKLTVTKSQIDDSYWVIVFGSSDNPSINDTFYSLKIDNTGINLVNESFFTFSPEDSDNTKGQIKVSPDTQSLAMVHNTIDNSGGTDVVTSLFTFDFDEVTGIVSSRESAYTLGVYSSAYGVEFSSDSNLLYFSSTTATGGQLQQVDYKNTSSIPTTLYSGPNFIYGLQSGIDDKIYSVSSTGQLGTVNNPNISGSGANYVDQNIDLSPANAELELPQLIPAPMGPVMKLLKVYNTSFANDTITKIKATDSGVTVFGIIGADNEDNLPGLGDGFIAEYNSTNDILSSQMQQIPYETPINIEENVFAWDTLMTSSSDLNGNPNESYKLSKYNSNNSLDFEITTVNINETLIEDSTSEQTLLLFPTSSYQDFSIVGSTGRTWTKSATQNFAQDSTVFTKTYNLARFDNSGTLINVIELLNYKWARNTTAGTDLVTFPAKIVGDGNTLYFTVTSRDEGLFTEKATINLNDGQSHKNGEWLISYDIRNNIYTQAKLIGQNGSVIPTELIYNQSTLFKKRKNDIYKLDSNLNETDSLSFTKLEIFETNPEDGSMLVRGGNSRTIKKIDINLNEVWSKVLGKKFTIEHASEAPDGSVYISGSYIEDAKFDNPETIDLAHNVGTDVFIALLDGLPIEVPEMKVTTYSEENESSRNSLEQTSVKKEFLTFPNPFENSLSIVPNLKSNFLLQVFDQNGRLVYKKNLKKESNENHSINTSKFTSGMYYLKITDENSKTIYKNILKL